MKWFVLYALFSAIIGLGSGWYLHTHESNPPIPVPISGSFIQDRGGQ